MVIYKKGLKNEFINLKNDEGYIKNIIEKVNYNANYDSLTGIFNRRKVIEKINKLISSLDINKEKIYIAMIDIDNFKKINDVYGHIIGDRVLCEVSNTIRSSIDKTDIIGRYGGEEFIVVVKEYNNFMDIIENIRKNIEDLKVDIGDGNFIDVTISIGVTNLDINKESLEKSITLADKALYKAKNTGKNKVVFLT